MTHKPQNIAWQLKGVDIFECTVDVFVWVIDCSSALGVRIASVYQASQGEESVKQWLT